MTTSAIWHTPNTNLHLFSVMLATINHSHGDVIEFPCLRARHKFSPSLKNFSRRRPTPGIPAFGEATPVRAGPPPSQIRMTLTI